MSLIIETGAGLSGAESYVNLADAAAYAEARGLTFAISGDDEALAEQALRRATTWLDATYRSQFPGDRKNLRQQALEWPRIGAYDRNGYNITDSEIPRELVAATIEAAVREKASPGALSPDVTPGQIAKMERVEGAVTVEYAIGSGVISDQRPVSTVIDDILGSLLCVSRGPALFGVTVR
jgi:hypothetical protein